MTERFEPNQKRGCILNISGLFSALFFKKEVYSESILLRKNDLSFRIAIIFLGLALPYIGIFYYLDWNFANAMVILTVLLYGASIVLNKATYYSTSKSILIICTSVSFFVCANILGPSAGAQFLLFALIPLPLLLFEYDQVGWITACVATPIGTYFLLELGHYSWIPYIENVNTTTLFYIRNCAILTTFLLLILSVGTYFVSNRRYETLLEQQNIDLLKHRALLQESWKDATYAQLMRNIAHEIKNPLFATSMTLSTIEDDIGNPEELKLSVRAVEDTISDLMQIVDVMLETGSAFTSSTTRHNIPEIVNRILLLFRTKLTRQEISFRTQCAPGLPEIMSDSKALLLVLSNLITNSAEAMPTGGHLKITIDPMLSDTTGQPGILIGIHDTGHGIEKTIQASIFQQFFTTKADGLQHGLGLSLVSSLVNQMGGKLWVESDPKKVPGAIFYVWFPVDHHLDRAPVQTVN